MMTKSQLVEALPAHVLVFPFPAQGHMLPLLDLAHLLSLRNLHITVIVTPKNLPLLSPLLSFSPTVQPLVLPFPSHPSLPPDAENTGDLPHSPFSFIHLMHALSDLHPLILKWANSISNPPVAIVSDFFLGWTHKLAHDLRIPRIMFSPSGALAVAAINYLWREMPKPDISNIVRFGWLPNSPVYKWSQVSMIYKCYVEGELGTLSEFVKEGFLANSQSWGVAFNTFEDLEGVYLDHIKKELGHSRVWAVGPLSLIGAGSAPGRGGPSSVPVTRLLMWLDGREEGSVVYICFGSQAVLSEAQTEAIGAGLERSGVHFVWGLRDVSAGPSEGFEKRTKGKGMLIRGWVPQVEILNHVSVGSFLTHCGWNSVLEGIAAGVAMLMWPMGADQFYNARLLEEEARIGVRVCEGPESVPDSNELGRILAASVSGDNETRARGNELSGKALAAVNEGGSSWRDMEALVDELNKLSCR